MLIGDVHGYYDLLIELISNIPDDDIYFVGDLIDRGKDSLKTLKFVMERNFKLVIGNHEKLMLDYLVSKDEFIKRWWFVAGGKEAYKEFFYEASTEEQDKIR